MMTDLYAAADRVGGGFVSHQSGAAKIDVGVVGNQLDGWRRDINRQVFLQHGFIATKKTP
jgi:hypothetical protein